MQVKVLYFGILKDIVGRADEVVDVPDAVAVRKFLEILRGRTSNKGMQEHVWQSLAVAVNREYAVGEVALCEGDEVALLPPVSGGGSQVAQGVELGGIDAD